MDIYATSNAKNKISIAECRLRSEQANDCSPRINDHRQNNNGVMNQMSFIPVYTKKTTMCNSYPKSVGNEKKEGAANEAEDSNKPVNRLQSPPVIQKCFKDQGEKLPGRTVHMYPRRRSVGFEDMTSTGNNYGCNLSHEKRHQVERLSSNLDTGSVISSKKLDSEADLNISEKVKERENGDTTAQNQNSETAKNENSLIPTNVKLSDQLKDKSSKRKSSLNRMDFVDFPPSCSGKAHLLKSNYNSNSSSDEGSVSKSQLPNAEFLSNSFKRKHYLNQSSLRSPVKKTELVSSKTSLAASRAKTSVLPKSTQYKLKHPKKMHNSAVVHLQKLSHSAGELESLTDASEVVNTSNKICLSAQEFDAHDSSSFSSKKSSRRFMQLPQPGKISCVTDIVRNTRENSSHIEPTIAITSREFKNLTDVADLNSYTTCPSNENLEASETFSKNTDIDSEQSVLRGFDLNGSLDLKHIDSRSEDESDLIQATSRVEHLDISSDREELYISAEENYDPLVSDSERRPSSILRRKQSEEKRELHGILKPPPANEKPSRTPASILKHRESSEEKDVWQQGDLHSILKKSTSEEESCNSGSDNIRPILKVSTDEESPSGSMRPRPILKKRTSFSEDCSYVSYANGELKPILKKKTPLSLEETPRPILKSRRKSEDARSSLTEFVASRPRAYSADMGVKGSLENRLEDLDVKENLSKPEYHDL